jgi:hypothetical protein
VHTGGSGGGVADFSETAEGLEPGFSFLAAGKLH